jgi:hypothetical protein
MFELLTFIIVVIVVFGLVLENIRIKNKNIELMFMLTQSYIDTNAIKDQITKTDDIEKDHLIKFLSDTRDLAFNHIENVNNHLLEFKKVIDDETLNTNENSLNSILDAFNKLKNIYPEDIPND